MLSRLASLLTRRERRWAFALVGGMVIQAGFELVGVASIVPFMQVVADPSVIHTNELISLLYDLGGFASDTTFLAALGLAMITVLAVTNGVSALVTWAILRFVWNTHHALSMRLLRGYLAEPYGFFVRRNTASLSRNILSEVSTAVVGVLLPLLTLTSKGLLTVAIIVLLAYIDPTLAVLVGGVLGGSYGLIYLSVRKRQKQLGESRAAANTDRYRTIQEAFAGIKDVKVLLRESAFSRRFAEPSRRYSRASASNAAIGQIPRYALETVAFGGILLIVVYMLQTGGGLEEMLPVLSLYAFAGYRLMPTLQQLFASVAKIRFNIVVIDDLAADLNQVKVPRPDVGSIEPLPFHDELRVEKLRFRHPGASVDALREVSLTVSKNRTVGVVGSSGAGKSTLVDLLLGLYTADSGRILVDDEELTSDTIDRWRLQIGYVPQHLFLGDDTIVGNIAFGIPPETVDMERVEHAARVAQIDDFVRGLDDGYDTIVGERGVRLSGGQRQRIGIARALYHDPPVLLLDEATSSLDGKTEEGVMAAIRDLTGRKTILVVAHRLRTLRDADCIYVMSEGRIVDRGVYESLASSSRTFRELAQLESRSD